MKRRKGQQPPGVTGGAGEDGPDGEQRRSVRKLYSLDDYNQILISWH